MDSVKGVAAQCDEIYKSEFGRSSWWSWLYQGNMEVGGQRNVGGGGSPKLPKKQLDVKCQRHYGRTQRQKQEAPDRKRIISESIA